MSRQIGHTNETLGNLVQEFRRTNNMLRVFVETIGSNEQTYQVPRYEQLLLHFKNQYGLRIRCLINSLFNKIRCFVKHC